MNFYYLLLLLLLIRAVCERKKNYIFKTIVKQNCNSIDVK